MSLAKTLAILSMCFALAFAGVANAAQVSCCMKKEAVAEQSHSNVKMKMSTYGSHAKMAKACHQKSKDNSQSSVSKIAKADCKSCACDHCMPMTTAPDTISFKHHAYPSSAHAEAYASYSCQPEGVFQPPKSLS